MPCMTGISRHRMLLQCRCLPEICPSSLDVQDSHFSPMYPLHFDTKLIGTTWFASHWNFMGTNAAMVLIVNRNNHHDVKNGSKVVTRNLSQQV